MILYWYSGDNVLSTIRFRLSNGSFTTTLPKPLGIELHLDEMLNVNEGVNIIAESVEKGVLIRHPTEEEVKRFDL